MASSRVGRRPCLPSQIHLAAHTGFGVLQSGPHEAGDGVWNVAREVQRPRLRARLHPRRHEKHHPPGRVGDHKEPAGAEGDVGHVRLVQARAEDKHGLAWGREGDTNGTL